MMRKTYEKTKSGPFALGYIDNISTYIGELQRLTDETVDIRTLESRLLSAYEGEKDLNYYYEDNGNIAVAPFDERRTCRYAIETGYLTSDKYSSGQPEMIYAYYTKDKYNKWTGVRFAKKYQMENYFNSYRFGNISFRNYGDANDFICKLRDYLLPGEVWNFRSNAADDYRPRTQYDILQSYLQFVFDKLLGEYRLPDSKNFGKIVFSTNKRYALFNTGLLSEFADDVFLVGEVYNQKLNGTFTFSNPCVAPGKVDLMRKYGFPNVSYPGVVEFFHNVDEIIFDANVEIDLSPDNLSHIIKDGAKRDRFPPKYTEIYSKGDFASIATTLKTSIENAQKIAKRNYKYVVPQYRGATQEEPGKIQFLMPIYLDKQYGEKPDFALVLNEEKIGSDRFYTPETILELAWAYNNARVICKPEDTWLNPMSIDSDITSSDSEEA